MIMKELGLQLYTIRDFMKTEEDIRESFQKMRKYGYTQAQTAGSGTILSMMSNDL